MDSLLPSQTQAFIILAVDEALQKHRSLEEENDMRAVELLQKYTQEAVSFNFTDVRMELDNVVTSLKTDLNAMVQDMKMQQEEHLQKIASMKTEMMDKFKSEMISLKTEMTSLVKSEITSLREELMHMFEKRAEPSQDDIDDNKSEISLSSDGDKCNDDVVSLEDTEMKLFGKTFHKEKVDQKKNAKIVNSEDEQEEVESKKRGRKRGSKNKTLTKREIEEKKSELEEENKKFRLKLAALKKADSRQERSLQTLREAYQKATTNYEEDLLIVKENDLIVPNGWTPASPLHIEGAEEFFRGLD